MQKEIAFEDLSYPDKRKIFREYSIKDQILDYVNVICDECINLQYGKPSINIPFWYKDGISLVNNYFGGQQDNEISKEDYNAILETYNFIMKAAGFDDELNLWHLMKDFIVDGFISIEIIWDNTGKDIIGFNRLNPTTLVPAHNEVHGKHWIQYPDDEVRKRILYDSQVIYLAYSTHDNYDISYVHRLIKPFNQLSILENTVILAHTINGKNLDVNMAVPDTKMLEYFSAALRRASRIPTEYNRLSNEPLRIGSDIERNTFNKFIKRLKNEFKKIINKPLQLQLQSRFAHIPNINTISVSI